jgi:hypothetical protein
MLESKALIDNNLVDMRRGFGIGKYPGEFKISDHIKCSCCNDNEARKVREVTIYHYEALLMVMKISKEQLNPYYRNYRSIAHIPYTGNFELRSKHPYLEIIEKDPCSLEHINGITLNIFLCGRCHNNYKKKS